jgi:hypothetical protein
MKPLFRALIGLRSLKKTRDRRLFYAGPNAVYLHGDTPSLHDSGTDILRRHAGTTTEQNAAVVVLRSRAVHVWRQRAWNEPLKTVFWSFCGVKPNLGLS